MNRRTLRRHSERLGAREASLHVRFLAPHLGIMAWNPVAIDAAAAYVALLHSELENSIESMILALLINARASSEQWRSHPVLVNCVSYYQWKLSNDLAPIRLCPNRAVLETDSTRLIHAWDTLGAKEFFGWAVARNHGAGMSYLETLLHPVGIVIDAKTFSKYEGRGVKEVASFASGFQTELTEFTLLRGSAVHAGASAFHQQLLAETPILIRNRGAASVRLVQALAKLISTRAW